MTGAQLVAGCLMRPRGTAVPHRDIKLSRT
jgi:hypothetical protein